MFARVFYFLTEADALFWGHIGFSIIIGLGLYLTVLSRGFQFRAFPHVIQTFLHGLIHKNPNDRGVHPLQAFFASAGGMIGVGNVVGIITSVQLGGPGALFWVWIAGFLGTVIKYSEVFLGMKYRIQNESGSFDGGPMFFLRKAFRSNGVSLFVCILLCIYGAEIYQFNVVLDTVTLSWGLNRYIATFALLSLVIYAALGGVGRVGKICSVCMPIFLLIYTATSLWVIGSHFADLPGIFRLVFNSAFSGNAVTGGLIGGSMMLAIQNGMAGACYSADLGIGADSIVQSESQTIHPERQALIAFFGVCLDNLICTLSILVVLVTDLWHIPVGSNEAPLVQIALSQHFSGMDLLMSVFIFILGYTSLISYLTVGAKCAKFLFPAYGKALYLGFSTVLLTIFSFFDQEVALLVMRIAGGLLLIANLSGIILLRKEVSFALEGS